MGTEFGPRACPHVRPSIPLGRHWGGQASHLACMHDTGAAGRFDCERGEMEEEGFIDSRETRTQRLGLLMLKHASDKIETEIPRGGCSLSNGSDWTHEIR